MSIELKADVGEKVTITETNQKGTVVVIHGYGSTDGFTKLYEPAFEIETDSGECKRYSSEDFEKEKG